MKYFITLFLMSFGHFLFAQELIYKPIKGVINKSFEEGSQLFKQRKELPGKGKKGIEGWYIVYANSFEKEKIKITNEEAHSGEYALKVSTNSEAKVLYKGLVKNDPIKIKSPGKYQVSYWVKASNPDAKIKIQVFTSKDAKEQDRKIDGNGKNVPLLNAKPLVQDFQLSTNWKQVKKHVVVTKKDLEKGFVYISPSLLLGETPNVTFYIDDLSIDYVMKKVTK